MTETPPPTALTDPGSNSSLSAAEAALALGITEDDVLIASVAANCRPG